MSTPRCCILVPTYNNGGTVATVLRAILAGGERDVIVVNDGSTDNTADVLRSIDGVQVLTNDRNRGKGFSLHRGFEAALAQGFDYAITIDSDGQHAPAEIAKMRAAIAANPGSMIMGTRDMSGSDVPGKSSFGNRFSNFWFRVETGWKLDDTQTGFRAYPLKAACSMRAWTKRFEYEIEVIVRLAWRDVPFVQVPVSVRYDFAERVSHFRPGRDFFRISVLNSVLVTLAFLWHWPKQLLTGGRLWQKLKAEAVRPEESSLRKALSIGFGLFMGIVPIWGFQLAVGIPLAFLLKLNRVLFVAAANISIPPMIPLILYGSYMAGAPFVGDDRVRINSISALTLDAIHWNVMQYLIGAVILAVLAGLVGTVVSIVVLRLGRGR
ncbi:MAG: DUF2062 domain-containing protein [Flavobacteriales bacterium]|nr:DUF2062 domain-containing protein [Flavobacteriales bacterium]MBP6697370.1 DUF2062 domain-containing protein [Flavobacteriales bacterium]